MFEILLDSRCGYEQMPQESARVRSFGQADERQSQVKAGTVHTIHLY